MAENPTLSAEKSPSAPEAAPAPAKRSRRRAAPVTAVTPDPLVWKEALRLAKGDTARLVVEDTGSVIVLKAPADSPRTRTRKKAR